MQHEVVSRDEWLKARTALLAREKAFTRLGDELAAEQRALPWVRIDKQYVFDGPAGKVTLADLFGSRSQLFLKHFMMAPGQTEQCVGCSLEVDHVAGLLGHLDNNDVAYVAVARAPIGEIEVLKQRMGWRFPFVSAFDSDFNYDFNVSFTKEEVAAKSAFYNFRQTDPYLEDLSGESVFCKDETGRIFHTYSSFGRGGEQFLGIYGYFDVMPRGRNENGPHYALPDWARPHDTYGNGGMVEPTGRFHAEGCACGAHG